MRARVQHAGGQPPSVPEQHPGLPEQLQRQQLLPSCTPSAGAQLRAERDREPELAQLLRQVQVAVQLPPGPPLLAPEPADNDPELLFTIPNAMTVLSQSVNVASQQLKSIDTIVMNAL